MKQDRSNPALCPVNDFYTLCDLDNAWKHFENAAAVHRYRLPPNRNSLKVDFKDALLDTPFWRKTNIRGDISDTEGLTAEAAAKALAFLGQRAGFRTKVRPYDLRRGAANVLQSITYHKHGLCTN